MRWIIPIVILPVSALILVPAILLFALRNTGYSGSIVSFRSIQLWISLVFMLPGILFAIGSCVSFFRHGDGTPAPWDPPQNLVVQGLYRYVRNPMLSGVIVLLISESLFLQSWILVVWTSFFFIANAIYFPLFEEPKLLLRFGKEYSLYCKNVPRWIPRFKPWIPINEDKI